MSALRVLRGQGLGKLIGIVTVIVKEGKMVAKIIKKEAKAEKAALEQAVRELAELQRTQKYAVKVRSSSLPQIIGRSAD